ncbi:MAG: cytochrome c [Acidimicrobiia bacterium]|nr:cytochrome c [Acidimicrobiia bacterium]MDH4362842.1 cytochrome c [Acidimicrobiia bacterium]
MATLGPIRAARFRAVFLLALAWPLLAAACGGADVPQVPADDAQLVTGRMVYANNCAPCHGANGGGGVGAKLNGGKLVEQIPDPTDQRLLVENGRNQMPAFSQKLSSEEIAAVVRYTREIINEQ